MDEHVWCWREDTLHAVVRVSSRTLCGYYAFVNNSWRPCQKIPEQARYCGTCSIALSQFASRPARHEDAQAVFDLASQLDDAMARAPEAVKRKVLTERRLGIRVNQVQAATEFLGAAIDALRTDLDLFNTQGGGEETPPPSGVR